MKDPQFSKFLMKSFGWISLVALCSLIISCSSARKLIPEEDKYYSFEGYSRVDEPSYNEAIGKLTKRIERNPENAEAYSARGFTYMRSNRFNEALADYNKSISIAPSLSSYVNRSKIFRKLGNYKDAFSDLKKAEALDSANIFLDASFGSFYMDVNDYDRAGAYFIKSYNNGVQQFTCLYNLGKCYSYQKKFEKALECYNAALAIDPGSAPVYNNSGVVYMQFGKFDEGINSFNKAIEYDPDFYSPYYNMGNAYFNSGEFTKAIGFYEKALKLTDEPNNLIVVYCNLSRLMYLTEKYTESIDYGNKVLSYNENLQMDLFINIARHNMAISHLKLSEPDFAWALYTKCFENDSFSNSSEMVEEVTSDLIDHYKSGADQMIVRDILLNIVGISEEDLIKKLNPDTEE